MDQAAETRRTDAAAAARPAKPTMKTLADHVGVSRQLVSIVLRNLPGASEETRKKVLQAAEDLGYYPDASARVLRGRRSFRLGVLFTMHQPFEVDLVEALFESARSHGFSLVLGPLTKYRRQSTAMAELLGQRVEGLFLLAAEGGSSTIDELPYGIPAVVVGGPTAAGPYDDLRVDDAHGIHLLMEHLFAMGHTRICHVSGGNGPGARARREAYAEAMATAGLSHLVDVIEGAYTEEAGSSAATQILSRTEMPTAIMGANDRSAIGMLGTLRQHGSHVPEDVTVVGFDDSSASRLPYIRLTTVGFAPKNLADRAIEVMMRRIDDASASIVEYKEQPHLAVRATSGRPRQDRKSLGVRAPITAL